MPAPRRESIEPTSPHPADPSVTGAGRRLQKILGLRMYDLPSHKRCSSESDTLALLQHALGDLEQLSIDVGHLQAKRDRLVSALRGMGYDLKSPDGTFYLLVRSPLADDSAFVDLLAEQKVICLPGTVFEMPGYFRISLTANDAMIDRALPGFERAIRAAEAAQP